MDEFNSDNLYEEIYDVVPEETPVEEIPVEETPVEETPVEQTPVQNDEVKKEEEQKITIEDIKDILKVVTNNEDSENKENLEKPVEETPVEENPVEETPVKENEEKEIVTNDYTEILNNIQREVSSGNSENQDAQEYILDYIDNHSVYTPIDSISIDTLLLVLIFMALLTNILVNLIRRLF